MSDSGGFGCGGDADDDKDKTERDMEEEAILVGQFNEKCLEHYDISTTPLLTSDDNNSAKRKPQRQQDQEQEQQQQQLQQQQQQQQQQRHDDEKVEEEETETENDDQPNTPLSPALDVNTAIPAKLAADRSKEIDSHIQTIKHWIEKVHRISRRPKTTSNRSLFGSGDNLPYIVVEDNFFPTSVELTKRCDRRLKALNIRLLETAADDAQAADRLVDKVARIPSLMKTILLIDDNDDRNRVLSYPFIKRVMMSKHSVISLRNEDFDGGSTTNNTSTARRPRQRLSLVSWRRSSRQQSHPHTPGSSWLVKMLKARNMSARTRAVDYLELISNLTLQDYLLTPKNEFGTITSPQPIDEDQFIQKRNDLFDTVANLQGLFSSMLMLRLKDMERASITDIVRRALDNTISRPFGIAIVFLDFLFHILLLFGWRVPIMSQIHNQHNTIQSQDDIQNKIGPIILTLMGVLGLVYFVFREVGEMISMVNISWRAFRIHLLDFWNMVDLAAISMVIVTTVVFVLYDDLGDTVFFTLAAVSIGLLWLKFLGFLKIVNWKLATFILAIVQIVKDTKLFLAILLIVVLAFGDMLFTILASDEQTCNAFSENPFCTNRAQSYLSVYRILIGEISMEYYQSTQITTILFVLLTFFGVIIMFNILIAIVDESYEKSTWNSERLFGRTRLAFAAKIAALEKLLEPRRSDNNGGLLSSNRMTKLSWLRFLMRCFSGIIALMVFVIFSLVVDYLVVFLQNEIALAISLSAVTIVLFVFLVSMTFLITGWDTTEEERLRRPKHGLIRLLQNNLLFQYVAIIPVRFLTQRLLGTSEQQQQRMASNTGSSDGEWQGRLRHIDTQTRKTLVQSEQRVRQAIVAMEMRMAKRERWNTASETMVQFEQTVCRTMEGLKTCLEDLEERAREERRLEMKMMEERLVKVLRQRVVTTT